MAEGFVQKKKMTAGHKTLANGILDEITIGDCEVDKSRLDQLKFKKAFME